MPPAGKGALVRAACACWFMLLWAWLPAGARPVEANLLVLEVRLDGHVLSDGLNAYTEGRDVLLPLGELSRLLTLAITVRAEAGSASGFVVREDRAFGLNLAATLASVGGHEQRFDPQLAVVIGDDIYVAARLLSLWLPLELEVDLPTLELRVRPRTRLPLQERLDRESAASRLRGGTPAGGPDGAFEPRPAPYRWVDAPFIDQTLSQDVGRGGGATHLRTHYTAYATGDLLGMEGAAYLAAATQGPPADLRLTLARHDPDGGLLGPLGARSLALGDITVPAVPNVMLGSPAGAGIAVSNRALSQPTGFDRHSLRGDLPPGWDVTLYYNDALVGYQQAGADGRYAFDDLQLSFGMNEFRLVFSGPLGQVRVERQRFLLDQPLVKPGELVYALTQHADQRGGMRSVALLDFGLARGLAANAGFVRRPLLATGAPLSYALAGLRGYGSTMIVGAQFTAAAAGGVVADLGLKTRLGGAAVDLVHTERRRGFESELFVRGSEGLHTRDKLLLNGTLVGGGLPPLSLALEAARDKLESGSTNLGLLGRASALLGGTSVSNSLRWGRVGGAAAADGSLQLARRVADVGLNLQLGYALRPSASAQSLAIAADHSLAGGWRLNGGLLRTMANGTTVASGGLSRNLGSFGLAFVGNVSNRHDVTLGLQLSMAIGRDPRSGSWTAEAQPLAGTGAVSARAFIDRNLNGVFDPGEEPVPNAGFIVNGGGRHPTLTGADGTAFIGRLSPGQHTDLAIDPATLDDPQWRSLVPGVRVLPRPGLAQTIDFPVISTSEIDGIVWLVGKGGRRPIGDARIELVDASGHAVAETRSSSDGYYLLHQVPPGRFTLRIAPEQARRLKLGGALERALEVPAEGDFIGGIDFELLQN